jgi:2-desacetyl-2-hydroxyethyl bacteriochlorophyllide A dehydrogenase
MKAIVCEKPGVLSIQERPEPKVRDGEVLLRIRKVGVCGTDLHAFAGNQPFFTYPRVMGHELATEVVEISSGAKADASARGYKVGSLVAVLPYIPCGTCIACRNKKPNCCTSLNVIGVHTDGGMQELISLPAAAVIPAPRVTPEQIAIVECFAIGFHGVSRGQVKAGENAVIVGAGPIGIGAMHGLKDAGARVIAVDIIDSRLDYSKKVAKADHVINAKKEDAVKAVAELTKGEMATVVFDATGHAPSMMKAFDYVANGGRLVFLSLVQADISFKDPDFHRREITLFASRNSTKEDFGRVIDALGSGRADTSGFVTHTLKADRVPADFPSLIKPETGVIKAAIEF